MPGMFSSLLPQTNLFQIDINLFPPITAKLYKISTEHYINTRGREHQLAPAADQLGQNACRYKLRFSADLVRTLIDK